MKEETNTRIDLPSESADSDLIVITGKKADVDLARKKLLAIQAELEGTGIVYISLHQMTSLDQNYLDLFRSLAT